MEIKKLNFGKIKEKTKMNYMCHIRKYLKWCKERRVCPLNAEVAKAFYRTEYYNKGLSISSRKEVARALRIYLESAGVKFDETRSSLDKFCEQAVPVSRSISRKHRKKHRKPDYVEVSVYIVF